MPSHHQETIFPYSTEQLFALIADVEKYHEFLPWCVASRIIKREEDHFTAELVIRFKAFRSKYTSKVTPIPPRDNRDSAQIRVELLEGPFHHLSNVWQIFPDKDSSRIVFDLDFAFQSKMLDKLIGNMFGSAVQKMVGAFETRAEELYG